MSALLCRLTELRKGVHVFPGMCRNDCVHVFQLFSLAVEGLKSVESSQNHGGGQTCVLE